MFVAKYSKRNPGHAITCNISPGVHGLPDFITAKFDFYIAATYIKGDHNVQANTLSRDNLALFHSLHFQANQDGILVPQSLLNLLILSKPDWTAKHSIELWNYTFGMD